MAYPENGMKPEDLLHFVELDEFIEDWKGLGLDDELDLWALQIAIMSDPIRPPVVQGTGGLRKVRFSPPKWKGGKRGAVRVCYVYLQEHWTVLLVMAYGKGDKLDFSPEEKAGIKTYISRIKKSLDEKKLT